MFARWFAGQPENVEQSSGPIGLAGTECTADVSSRHAYVKLAICGAAAMPNAVEIAWHSAIESCAANQSASLIVNGSPNEAHTLLHASPHALGL